MNAEENLRLSLAGPGTPCGEMMRRYWIPVGVSEELKELPRLIRILNEDLVLFRDGRGRVGLLGQRCSHRGTSLEYGQVDQEGIRCCYHGWLYDVEGRVLDTPAEPPESRFKDTIRHLSYPCQELGGVVFAYMGPREKMPELPRYDFLVREDATRRVEWRVTDCNWLQTLENHCDVVHTALLHQIPGPAQFPPRYSDMPITKCERTWYGMDIEALRSNWRKTLRLYLPVLQITDTALFERADYPEDGENVCGNVATWKLPIDDTHSLRLMVVCKPRNQEGQAQDDSTGGGGGWIRGSYEDHQRGPNDPQAQMGQGPLSAREGWHMTASDKGVAMFHDILREAIDIVEEDGDPRGVIRDPEKARFVDTWPVLAGGAPTEPYEPWRVGSGVQVWGKRVLGTVSRWYPDGIS